jgi:tetratricopeptide (TPR) repeat protein
MAIAPLLTTTSSPTIVTTGAVQPKPNLQASFNEAKKLADAGNYPSALTLLSNLLDRAKQEVVGPQGKEFQAKILSLMSGIVREQGNSSLAAKYAGEAVNLLPPWANKSVRAESLNLLALALAFTEDPDKQRTAANLARAEGLLQEALKLTPDDPKLLVNLAGTLSKGGKVKEAEEMFERALKASGNGPTEVGLASLNGLAQLALNQDPPNLDDAFKHMQQAVKMAESFYGKNHPQVGALLLNLGVVADQLKKWDVAKNSYVRAYALMKSPNGFGAGDDRTLNAGITLLAFLAERDWDALASYLKKDSGKKDPLLYRIWNHPDSGLDQVIKQMPPDQITRFKGFLNENGIPLPSQHKPVQPAKE